MHLDSCKGELDRESEERKMYPILSSSPSVDRLHKRISYFCGLLTSIVPQKR